ncbi:hypothetical protein F8388_017675 [Cannabis sativa]|uniref:Neurobeachin alpha-solenoid region domain-containing protein n=1 Tax=Cannabis sativa TaxID=3483 RepID=A0A7J6HI50_CANSA|nr:hypothetical protein F8388_017675 [Cannabis sativa]
MESLLKLHKTAIPGTGGTIVSLIRWSMEEQNRDIKIECRSSWMGVEGLPLNLWNIKFMGKIGELCGGLLDVEKDTAEKTFLHHLRLKLGGDEDGFVPKSIRLHYQGSELFLKLFKLNDWGYRFNGFFNTIWHQDSEFYKNEKSKGYPYPDLRSMTPELSALLDAFEQSACNPEVSNVLAKSLLRILQLSTEKTIASCKSLNAAARVLKVACLQAQESKRFQSIGSSVEGNAIDVVSSYTQQMPNEQAIGQCWFKCLDISMELFTAIFSAADDARSLILHSSACIDCLFDLFWEERLRNNVLKYILELLKIVPASEEDQTAKLQLCSKYLEMFTQIKEREKSFEELSIDLLVGMRDILLTDPVYYQALFRDGECFLHVVSLLNGNLDKVGGEKLVLNVFQTLTCLLASNDASKAAFRALAGTGYQALQSLLLDFCQWHPSEGLLNALLDMVVDGKFDLKAGAIIKNEDVIILYLSVLRKSSESLQQHGLDVFQQLLRDSISNRASCVRAGMLNFLLDWFPQESSDSVIGGHSISGKDIRKIFALLRSEKLVSQQKYCSLLLSTVSSMLHEKGPTAFFDFNGNDSNHAPSSGINVTEGTNYGRGDMWIRPRVGHSRVH